MSTRASEGDFRCVWGEHPAPLAEAADDPPSICLDHLEEVAELEQRELVPSLREVV